MPSVHGLPSATENVPVAEGFKQWPVQCPYARLGSSFRELMLWGAWMLLPSNRNRAHSQPIQGPFKIAEKQGHKSVSQSPTVQRTKVDFHALLMLSSSFVRLCSIAAEA